jgi:ANTH domain
MSEVGHRRCLSNSGRFIHQLECIVYTWDYHSSMSIWTGLKVQPILADEVQTFKALITVHKILQEGHPVVCPNGSLFVHRLKELVDVEGGPAAGRVV